MTMAPEQLTKSDAEFESIIREKYPFLSLKKLPDGSEYLDAYTFWIHKGWSLRQESLVVELPRFEVIYDDYAQTSVNFYQKEEIDYLLQSAGINYREKE